MSWYCVDGEGIYTHTYCLMCDNTGRTINNPEGLSTDECLEFLLEPVNKSLVGAVYGLNYDANNWLKDLPEKKLRRLWDTGWIRYKTFLIHWVPGKWFYIKDRKTHRSLKLFEVVGFFQMKFVEACIDWDIYLDAKIEEMKDARGSFVLTELADLVRYCCAECIALSELMDRLEETVEAVGLQLKSWHGAGAIAAALMRREGVIDHHAYDVEISDDVSYTEIMRSYFGGRVEPLAQGFVGDASYYDVVSAYPTATRNLPALKGARLEHITNYDRNENHAIWRVRWKGLSGYVMPFPVRDNKGAIYYPTAGEGTYHAVEVRAALYAGFHITVLEGWILRPSTSGSFDYPFSWVDNVFQVRKLMKKEGDLGQKILKLALNSIYGKTAQSIGEEPPFRSYWWAGEITAYTRARMLDLAMRCNPAPFLIATDGIFCPHDLKVKLGNELGDLECEHIKKLFIGRAGVYRGTKDDGKYILKTRGFYLKDVIYKVIEEGYGREDDDYVYGYVSKRFTGLGLALQRRDFDKWRKWNTEDRELSFFIRRKHKKKGELFLNPWTEELDISEPYKCVDNDILQQQLLDPMDDSNPYSDVYSMIGGTRV